MAGMGLSPPGTPQQAVATELPRIKGDGINTGSFDVWWDVDAETKTEVTPGSITISDSDLKLAIQKAKAAGLKVVLEPKVWCPRCRPSTWRGYLQPDDVNTFFDNYRAMIDHYAEIAQQTGVDIFYIGSEMSMVQDETDQWRQVAAEARARYSGTLTYGVNWNVLDRVHFWNVVDLVSVSAYFPLSGDERPSIDDLKSAWKTSQDPAWKGRHWFDELVALHNDTRKPIFFGEAGYLSSTYAAHQPYDETATHDPDQKLQSDAYQALLETFEGQSWWAGVVWWEWTLSNGNDMSYSPRNKVAEQLLKSWYVDGWRPSSAQRTVWAPAPRPAPAPGGAASGAATGSGRTAQGAPARTGPTTAASPNPATGPATTGAGAPTTVGPSSGGDGTLGATPGRPGNEQALRGAGTRSSRSPVVPIAVGALLLVLLPLSALIRSRRRPTRVLAVEHSADVDHFERVDSRG